MRTILILLALCQIAPAANWLTEWGTPVTPAAGDVIAIQDVSDTSVQPWGKARATLVGSIWSSLSGVTPSQMADADWGSFSLSSGTATIDNGAVTAAMLADADWGHISISSGSASIDADVITAAMLADGDWGDLSISTNSATVDDDVLEIANMADGDWGDFSIATNSATLDAGVVDTGELAADAVDDTKVDWGTGANQVSGADVPLADSGAYFTTDDVESALQELGAAVPASKLVTFTLTLANVDDGADFDIAYVTEAFTITEMVAVHSGTGLSSPSIVVDVRHSTDRSAAGNQVETTAWTVTSSTSGAKLNSGFEDATVPADSFIWVETSGVSGTTDNLSIHVIGTYD